MKKRKLRPQVKTYLIIVLSVLVLCFSVIGCLLSQRKLDAYEGQIKELQTTIDTLEKESTEKSDRISKYENEVKGYTAIVNSLENKVKELEKGTEDKEKSTKETKEDKTEDKKEEKYNGKPLTAAKGTIQGPSGKETYYNLDMTQVVENAWNDGIEGEYWEREDGAKMIGDYIILACDVSGKVHSRYDIVETSMGLGICADTGSFAKTNPTQIDIATTW